MGLSAYNKKRHFGDTPEPEGKEKSSKGHLRFVVQKHDASSLHYDFRLEMDGVLKSWAVPKGPSLKPSDKRLAMQVEDHPFAYRNFEGVIPKNNYGAGTVIVWDEGYYEPVENAGSTRKEQEEHLLEQLEKGSVKFVLHGKKLKGAFVLFQLKGKGGKAWMLVKKSDLYSSEEEVTLLNQSVKTGKTLADVAREKGTAVNHPEEETKKMGVHTKEGERPPQKSVKPKATFVQSKSKKGSNKKAGQSDGNKTQGKKAAMPEMVVPMLSTLVDEPFDDPSWLFEIKWDGYRAVAYCKAEKVELLSRNLTSFTKKYLPVAEALKSLGLNAVLDGEIVAVNEKGLANFQMLQNWQNTPVHLQFFVFDILWLNGNDVTKLPLIERKALLQKILPAAHEVIRYSDHVVGNGKDFFKVAVKQGLEGIMAKRTDSPYLINARSKDWVKIKTTFRQEVVIAGFTEPRASRKFFGSLLLGVYEGNNLRYVGHTGSGFTKKNLEEVYAKLQPLVTGVNPFKGKTKTNMPATWVKPQLVCEIKFTEWTKDRMARHPIFMGLRNDKNAKDVKAENTTTMATIKEQKDTVAKEGVKKIAARQTTEKKKKSTPVAAKKSAKTKTTQPATSLDLSENEQKILLNGHELTLTNLQKFYWKKEGFTKGDTVDYYLRMAPFILPYLLDRPLSLNRHPSGVGQPNFFQKDVRGKVPEWMQTHEDFSESTGKPVEYLVCSNEATLIYMANLGCIEINPWHSKSQSWQQPDWCLIDLDPDKNNSYQQVVEVALLTKKILDDIGVKGCVKTSGSTGMHIYIPLGAKYHFEESKNFAELLVNMVNKELPELTSIERNPAKRKGKIYLDFLQNSETQTAAAPYSLRPKPGMPVSTPLDWSELKKGLTNTTWNALNIFERLKQEGDLFKAVLGKGIDLKKAVKKLGSISK